MGGGLKDRGLDLARHAAQPDLGLPAATTASAAQSDPDPNAGHRQRLKDRFMAGGEEALAGYELLELILFNAIPRRDTKPLAKKLIARFGSFAGVVHATPQALREVSGVGDGVVTQIKLVRAAALNLLRHDVMEKPILGSWQAVLDYCRVGMAFETREQFRILFLDKKNRLIADEVQQTGTVDHTPVYVREVVKRALEHASSAIVLVHNHPSGDPTPSRADIDMTHLIISAAKPLGITVHDHIIVGRQGHMSFKGLKLI